MGSQSHERCGYQTEKMPCDEYGLALLVAIPLFLKERLECCIHPRVPLLTLVNELIGKNRVRCLNFAACLMEWRCRVER